MVRLTDRPDMTLDVYRGRKTTIQQYKYLAGDPQNNVINSESKMKILNEFSLKSTSGE